MNGSQAVTRCMDHERSEAHISGALLKEEDCELLADGQT
jgi:hypothetical protein